MRLIDADAVMDKACENLRDGDVLDRIPPSFIDNAPTVDAVPVVRCKDCVHWDDDPDTYGADDGPKGKCMKSFETMRADDFCSYGERREDA